MRKLVLAAIAVILVIVIGVAVYATRSFQHRVEARVSALQQEIEGRTRLETRTAGVHVRWLPSPAVVVDDVTVRTRKQAGGDPLVEKARVIVVPELSALLVGRQEIERIEVHDARFVTRPEERTSATVVVPFLREAAVPVALRDCRLALDRGVAFPVIEAHHVDLDFVPRDGRVAYSGTMSPLGEKSHADVSGTWQPGAGRTGGDAFKIDLKVRDGDPATIVPFATPLKRVTFTDEVELDLTAEGFLGERTTETMPAEPLTGRVRAQVGIDILGVAHPAVFESAISLDDRRWVFQDGKGKWGERPFTYAGWIARGASANKTNLRLSFQNVSPADVMAEYGIEERWRVQGDLTGEIRMEGNFDYPLTRYEMKTPSLEFSGFSSLPMTATAVTLRGTLLAINADVSCSMEANELKIGPSVIPKVLVGSTWWKKKLLLTSLNLPLWGGKIDGSVAYEPAAEEPWRAGAVLHDLDADQFISQVLPDSGLKLDGKLDASGDGGYRDGEAWYRGRIGVHEGTLGPHGWLRAVAGEIVAKVGADTAALDALATRHPTLAADKMPFTRIAIDFQRQTSDIAVRVGDLVTEGGTMTLDGKVDGSRRIDAVGVAELGAAVSADLAHEIPALAKLLPADGALQVPVRVEGPAADLKVALGQDFADALDRARQGKSAGPFTAAKPKPSFELEDLEPLDEQFGR